MKIGICVVTCDRPNFLKSTLSGLEGPQANERVIVDNGSKTRDEVQQLANVHHYHLIDGKKGSSPQGQNLGLEFLANNGCEAILKSDDDLRYQVGYLTKLVRVFNLHRGEIGAAGGVCWSKETGEILHRRGNIWRTLQGREIRGEEFFRYRLQRSAVIKVRHLHGAYLYDVDTALQLASRAQEVRGYGAFPEYLSRISHREETEFTYLLRAFMNKNLYLVTDDYILDIWPQIFPILAFSFLFAS